ncbi:hypothetical protein BGZ52_011829, partial [Haplosporangium bisporale]
TNNAYHELRWDRFKCQSDLLEVLDDIQGIKADINRITRKKSNRASQGYDDQIIHRKMEVVYEDSFGPKSYEYATLESRIMEFDGQGRSIA